MRYLFSSYNYDLTDPGSIPNLFVQHLYLVGLSMLISLVIALPLGVIVARYRRLYLPIVGFSGLLYTIPGIALIAELIPLTKLTLATAIIIKWPRRQPACPPPKPSKKFRPTS